MVTFVSFDLIPYAFTKQCGLAGEVRRISGGLEALVALLDCEDEAVLCAAAATVATVARDPANLCILTDYGAVTCLSRLAVRVCQGGLGIAYCEQLFKR